MKRLYPYRLLLCLFALMLLPCLMSGQGANRKPPTPPVELSKELYPIITDSVVSSDGKEHPLVYRKPVGDGPYPVILFFHGGVRSFDESGITQQLNGATPTRFLNKGYMIVMPARRETKDLFAIESPKSFTGGLIYDALASVEKTKELPGADPDSIVIFGGSAGGSLAIESLAYTDVAALVLGEANPTLFTGLWLKHAEETGGIFGRTQLYVDFDRYFTDEIRENVRYFFSQIKCPILFLNGGNRGKPMPEMPIFFEAVEYKGNNAKNITYPKFTHGFYFGGGQVIPTGEELDEMVKDTHRFILPYLKTKPKPL